MSSSAIDSRTPSPSPSPPPSSQATAAAAAAWHSSPFSQQHFKSQSSFLRQLSHDASVALSSQTASLDACMTYSDDDDEEELMLPPASQFEGLRNHSAHTLTPPVQQIQSPSTARFIRKSARDEATPSPLASRRLLDSPPPLLLPTRQLLEQGDSSVEFITSVQKSTVPVADTTVEVISSSSSKKPVPKPAQVQETYTGSYKLTLFSSPLPQASASSTSSAASKALPLQVQKPAPAPRARPKPKARAKTSAATTASDTADLAGPSHFISLLPPPVAVAAPAPRKRARPTKKQKQLVAEAAAAAKAKETEAWIETESSNDDGGARKRKGKAREKSNESEEEEESMDEEPKPPKVKKKKLEKGEDNGFAELRTFPPSRLTLLMTCPLCALSLMDMKSSTSKRTHLVRCAPQSGLTPEASLYALLHEEKRLLTRQRARLRKAEEQRSLWDRLIATAPGQVNKPKKQRKTNAQSKGPRAVDLDGNVLRSAREDVDSVHERLEALFGKCQRDEDEEDCPSLRIVNLPESQMDQQQQEHSPSPHLMDTNTNTISKTYKARSFSRSKLALRPHARHTRGLGLQATTLQALFTAGSEFGRLVAARYARGV